MMRQGDAAVRPAGELLAGLQILRGTSALLVIIDHAILTVIPLDPRFAPLLAFAGTIGKMGVNIFFTMSGFVMMHTTEPLREFAPTTRVSSFFWKRLTRMAPLYWFCTIVMILLGAIEGLRYSSEHILTSFLFLPNFEDSADPRMTPIVGVGWTITYEMLFYAIFGACLLLPRSKGPVLCVMVIGLMVLIGSVVLHHVPDGEMRRVIAFYSYKNMLFFAAGIGLAMAVGRIPRIDASLALGAALALMTAALAAYRQFDLRDGSLAWQSISFPTCCCAVMLAAASRPGTAFPGRRLLLHIGNASFSTYLFHAPIMHLMASLCGALFAHRAGTLFILTAGPVCLVAGSLIHYTVELPLTRWTRDGLVRGAACTKSGALAS